MKFLAFKLNHIRSKELINLKIDFRVYINRLWDMYFSIEIFVAKINILGTKIERLACDQA